MGRQEAIARSVAVAIRLPTRNRPRRFVALILAKLSALLALYHLALRKIRPADFANLRRNHWDVTDDTYLESFQPPDGQKAEDALHTVGDMGFSGSTFYATSDQKYLVKSVPRHSEHSFFRDDLLTPYVEYMADHPFSLIVRICDFLCVDGASLGRMLGLVPSHHIVMENIMRGEDEAKKQGIAWEHWDLKPTSYFYPERDIAGGALTSQATKSQLADEFHDTIVLSKEQSDSFFKVIEDDTELLAKYNAVDYSLFLVRIKAETEQAEPGSDLVPNDPPLVPPSAPSWRAGVRSTDGKHIYRAAILDFFWAKHKVQPRVMTVLIKLWNLFISKDGPMSITTTPDEYRERFLNMCHKIVEVRDE